MKSILLSVLVISGFTTAAQTSLLDEINYNHLEKFLVLAKEQYPRTKILQLQQADAKNAIGMAKVSYLDLVNVSYFYRPEDQAALNPENPFIFNGFQVGVTLSPGVFFQKPYQVRSAKVAHEISKLQVKDAERTLETQVKAAYYAYVAARSDVRLKGELYQELNMLLDDVKFKYEKGETTLETYSGARTAAIQANGDLTESQMAYLQAKDELSELIGVPVDEVKFD